MWVVWLPFVTTEAQHQHWIHLPPWFNIIIGDSYLHFTHTKFFHIHEHLMCAIYTHTKIFIVYTIFVFVFGTFQHKRITLWTFIICWTIYRIWYALLRLEKYAGVYYLICVGWLKQYYELSFLVVICAFYLYVCVCVLSTPFLAALTYHVTSISQNNYMLGSISRLFCKIANETQRCWTKIPSEWNT